MSRGYSHTKPNIHNPTCRNFSGAPSNYVAGLGRGAVGFTTRSDIGPARTLPEAGEPGVAPAPGTAKDPDFGPAPVGYVAGRGRGMGDLAKSNSEGGSRGGGGGGGGGSAPGGVDLSESNYDEFSGYQERLFGDTPYDNDDEEADRIYEAIDEHVDTRRKRRREAAQLEAMKKAREERPKISDQFADLKVIACRRCYQLRWKVIQFRCFFRRGGRARGKSGYRHAGVLCRCRVVPYWGSLQCQNDTRLRVPKCTRL